MASGWCQTGESKKSSRESSVCSSKSTEFPTSILMNAIEKGVSIAWRELSKSSAAKQQSVPMVCVDQQISHTDFSDFPHGQTNRMLHRYRKENFIIFKFEKVRASAVRQILVKGVRINGNEYQFLGCSSSGLKTRTCYFYKGSLDDVNRILEECGSFFSIKSTSKLLKRIGLLFSAGIPTGIEIPDENVCEESDIETKNFNFTDGCGAVSFDLAAQIRESCEGLPPDYQPSVYQIRYQGCKGVVMVDHGVKKGCLLIRPSMKKFGAGTKPFMEVWLCEHSRPYTFGHLNRQFITLLSSLGVKDEVFLRIQEDHFKLLENMLHDSTAAFHLLQFDNQPELAFRCITSPEALGRKQLSKLRTKLISKLDKLRLLVPKSRNVFGVCDPTGKLKYGQCFFRYTDQDQPKTLHGKVVVAKNPCYLLGDVRVLSAVNVKGLEHLVDCIVFPTNGKRPHPSEIAGSDLDGDQYFVCWDEGLVVLHTTEPYDYPSIDAPETSRKVSRSMLIDYFASHCNSMGKIDACYKYWANKKGADCSECQDLGKRFSRSVDASKTGDQVSIPPRLKPPQEDENDRDNSDKSESTARLLVWEKMEKRASEMKMVLCEQVVLNDDAEAIDEDFVWDLLQNKFPNLSEFQLFQFLLCWCSRTYSDEKESHQNLLRFAKYIVFGEFTVDQQVKAIDAGIPCKDITNALNKSSLLPQSLLQKFLLLDPHHTWRFYFHSKSSEFNWKHLLRGIQCHPESIVVIKLLDEITFVLHFLAPPKLGETDVNGSIVAYFSSSHYGLDLQHVLGPEFKLNLDDQTLQIYRGVKNGTFIWLRSEQTVGGKGSTDILFDRISVDLTQFKRKADKHPKVKKENFLSIEVFVKSYCEKPAYLDIVEASNLEVEELAIVDDLQELPSDSEDDQSEKGDSCVLRPYSLENAIGVLLKHAKSGHLCQFQLILDQILSQERNSVPEIFTALQYLLQSMVTKYCHKSLADNAIISLQLIITSLSSYLKSPVECLKLLSNICHLHCPELAEHTLDLILPNLQSSDTMDFVNVTTNWKLWYFLPPRVAGRFARHLYTLYSLPVSTSQASFHYSNIAGESEMFAQDMKADVSLQHATWRYTNHFAHLLLTSLLIEISSLERQNRDKTDDTDTQLVKMKVYDCSSPCSSEEKKEDDGSDDEKFCKIGFHRSTRGVSSKNITLWSSVVVSIMKKVDSSDKVTALPVAIGRITRVCRHPADIVIEFKEPIPMCLKRSIKLQKGHWQLNLIANITGFNRALKALRALNQNPLCTGLSSVLVMTHTCSAMSSLEGSTKNTLFPSQYVGDEIPAGINESPLNLNQEEAVKAALEQRVTLIHGPPGTGKTHVACEIVKRQLARDTSSPVLVTAETNLAVDNLCEKLMVMGIRVVRIGKLDQLSHNIRAISLEGQIERKRIEEGKDKSRSPFPNAEKALERQILQATQVVAATCTSAGDPTIKRMKFPFVVIDEATQVTEPTSLIPLVHGCQQLTLIGDPEQLAPIVPTVSKLVDFDLEMSSTVSELSISLFHRLQKLLPSLFLNEQYRMHQELVAFPSNKFYGGKLETAPSRSTQDYPTEIPLLEADKPLVFLEVCGNEHCKEKRVGTSFCNLSEAKAVINVVKYLIAHQVSMQRMVVLTPYSGQVRCVRERLEQEKLTHVTVCTVDAFQGREMDFVIFSTVRCNTRGELGFTDDRYRMNVLLTRAKHGLVGIGCTEMLSKHSELWKEWLEQVKMTGCNQLEKVPKPSKARDDRGRSRRGGGSSRGRRAAYHGST